MGHAAREELLDLEPVFRVVRTWPDVRETSYGVFYVKRLPFLHFHAKDGKRWADVRDGLDWGAPVPIPPAAGRPAKARFQRRIEGRYRRTWREVTKT